MKKIDIVSIANDGSKLRGSLPITVSSRLTCEGVDVDVGEGAIVSEDVIMFVGIGVSVGIGGCISRDRGKSVSRAGSKGTRWSKSTYGS